jgi:hypothetical protein
MTAEGTGKIAIGVLTRYRQYHQLRYFDVPWLLQGKDYGARYIIGVEALLEAVVEVLRLLRVAESL